MLNKTKEVAITGISGFIASHLAERCITEGVSVRGVCRKPEKVTWLKEKGIELVKGELLSPDELKSAFAGCRVVVHAAGWSGSLDVPASLAWRTNVQGTINVIKAAKEANVERLIYISSVAVYGLNSAPLLHEEIATPVVGELYPDSKIEAERLVKESNIPYVIIRPGSIYGPRAKGWTIHVIEQMKREEMVLGNGSGKITPGYIDNFIDGLWLAMNSDAALKGVFNICDGDVMTYNEFYGEYAKMLQIKALPTLPKWKVIIAKSPIASTIRRIMGRPEVGVWSNHFRFNPSQYSIENARALLGYKPKISFEEGMRRTERWLKDNQYINSSL